MNTGAVHSLPLLAPPVALPRTIGPYRIQGLIGEGAMGVVYRALDPRLERPVALKTIRKSLLGTAAEAAVATQRLRTEAQAAARLSHPGIVAVHEFGEDGEQAYIAMEFVQGTPLAAAMARPEGLAIDDVLCLMVQLLAALQCAHEQGVWHRDIKPANLMVTPQGRLKIADFGIARIDAVALTHDAKVMGSPGYMAPECYRGAGVDQRADLYACGVLLFELLAGVRPFRGPPDLVMHKTLLLPPPALAEAGKLEGEAAAAMAAFEPIVQRALAKAPEDRYLSALEFRHELMFAADRPLASGLSTRAMRVLAPAVATVVATQDANQRISTGRSTGRSTGANIVSIDLPVPTPAEAPSLPTRLREVDPVSVRRAVMAAPVAAPPPSPVPTPSAPPTPPVALPVQAATALLLPHFGPIAGVLARRAAAAAASRDQFIEGLLDAIDDGELREADRRRWQVSLRRLR